MEFIQGIAKYVTPFTLLGLTAVSIMCFLWYFMEIKHVSTSFFCNSF
jgi:hypothetical protein